MIRGWLLVLSTVFGRFAVAPDQVYGTYWIVVCFSSNFFFVVIVMGCCCSQNSKRDASNKPSAVMTQYQHASWSYKDMDPVALVLHVEAVVQSWLRANDYDKIVAQLVAKFEKAQANYNFMRRHTHNLLRRYRGFGQVLEHHTDFSKCQQLESQIASHSIKLAKADTLKLQALLIAVLQLSMSSGSSGSSDLNLDDHQLSFCVVAHVHRITSKSTSNCGLHVEALLVHFLKKNTILDHALFSSFCSAVLGLRCGIQTAYHLKQALKKLTTHE